MEITRQTIENEIVNILEGSSNADEFHVAQEVAEIFAEKLDEEFEHNLRQDHYAKLVEALTEIFEDQIDWFEMDEIANPWKRAERIKDEREEAKADIYRGQHEQD